jgi:hypothetical protein
MSFAEWWKKSSKEASEAHYALRFDENELYEMRRGILSDSAKRKVGQRLGSLKKRNRFLLIGCGIPLSLIGLSILVTLGFVFLRALFGSSRNPIVWFMIALFVVVTSVITIFFAKILFEWRRHKSQTAIDLQGSAVGIDKGKVFIKITRSENSFNINYSMNGVEYVLPDDAIGWEIHTHFFGGPNITGQSSRETKEDYIFYCLPNSKLLLHFESA